MFQHFSITNIARAGFINSHSFSDGLKHRDRVRDCAQLSPTRLHCHPCVSRHVQGRSCRRQNPKRTRQRQSLADAVGSELSLLGPPVCVPVFEPVFKSGHADLECWSVRSRLLPYWWWSGDTVSGEQFINDLFKSFRKVISDLWSKVCFTFVIIVAHTDSII